MAGFCGDGHEIADSAKTLLNQENEENTYSLYMRGADLLMLPVAQTIHNVEL
jgi:hypothetical protein